MIIVSGLARSGTSLMMRMLQSGGIEVFTDRVRKPDEHNTHGYSEVEDIGKKLEENPYFLSDITGCCKVLSPFLRHLQGGHKIIYMERDLEEVAASMEKMSGIPVTPDERAALGRHVESMKDYLKGKDVIYVNYNNLVTTPGLECNKISDFVPELEMIKALGAIDKAQYRNRKK